MTLRLAIFDCDGTLVDSQHAIVESMETAFLAVALTPPERMQCLSVVGLSLPHAVARLVPDGAEEVREEICARYKQRFQQLRSTGGLQEPLYPGVAALLDRLDAEGWLLAVATGKSERGLKLLLQHHGMSARFVSLQTADRNPSKPHPAMIEAALSEAGVDRANAVMIGDTSFDMLMARAAGVQGLGVAWGYHQVDELIAAGAERVAMDTAELARHIGLP